MTSCAAGSPTQKWPRLSTPRSLEEGRGAHRPADRPPGQRPQPRSRHRPGRAVLRLALPRRVHRLPVRDHPGRGTPPRPRPGRAGVRRPGRRAPGTPAIRVIPRERRLAGLRRHRAQPAARRRVPGQPRLCQARGATLRRDLINIAARTARHGRGHLTLHLPEDWHRETEWMSLFEACACRESRPRL